MRPPGAAAWCLRHQGDVAAIVVATEMILDRAAETFSAGWFERGRNMLKDTSRAGALLTAASQLRRRESPSSSDGGGGTLVGLHASPGPRARGQGEEDRRTPDRQRLPGGVGGCGRGQEHTPERAGRVLEGLGSPWHVEPVAQGERDAVRIEAPTTRHQHRQVERVTGGDDDEWRTVGEREEERLRRQSPQDKMRSVLDQLADSARASAGLTRR